MRVMKTLKHYMKNHSENTLLDTSDPQGAVVIPKAVLPFPRV